jgi:hypothetical protein
VYALVIEFLDAFWQQADFGMSEAFVARNVRC